MKPTTMRMTAEQAAQSGDDGYWVLNGAADGPATRILQDRSGADVRAKTQQEAQTALAQAGHHYPVVERGARVPGHVGQPPAQDQSVGARQPDPGMMGYAREAACAGSTQPYQRRSLVPIPHRMKRRGP